MMCNSKLIFSAAFAIAASLGVGAASAADLSAAPVYTKAPIVAPVYDWTGFYIGGNIGGLWADTSGSATIASNGINVPGTVPFASTTASTFLGGGQLGYNRQFGHLVVGIEGDAEALHWSTTRTLPALGPGLFYPGVFEPGDNFSATSNWEASVRGRIGYAWDRLLVYATGGVAFTKVSVGTNFVQLNAAPEFFFPATSASDAAYLTGGTIGGGFEYGVLKNLSVGVEGRYTWYGSHTFNAGTEPITVLAGGVVVNSAPATQTLNINTGEILAKVNFRF